ncbi:hypothetical protein D3C87_1268350 [compost metagenome]
MRKLIFLRLHDVQFDQRFRMDNLIRLSVLLMERGSQGGMPLHNKRKRFRQSPHIQFSFQPEHARHVVARPDLPAPM